MAGTVDAIIIGAGHNGLAAALHLAASGWSVRVLEGAADPGGAVRTAECTEPGFRHDLGAMNLSLFAGSSFFKAYGEELAGHGCSFVPVDRPFASAFPGGRTLGVTTDPAQTEAAIRAISSRDADTWVRLREAFAADVGPILSLLGSPMTPRALTGAAWATLRAKGLRGTLDLARFLMSSPRVWLEETFEAPEVRAMLGAWGMHLDFAPDIAGGAVFPYLEGMAGGAFGMVLGQGGADTIVRAMVSAIEARGGTVETGATVTRILREESGTGGGRATGVETADGRRVTARRAVIAGVAPGALARLAGPMSPAFDAGLARFRHAPGTMMIHLATSAVPPWRAEALRSFAYVHLAPSLDAMAASYQQARAGLLPRAPVVVVGQPTVFDPSRAPDGHHVVWVQVRMAPIDIRGDAGGTIDATDWSEAVDPMAERVLDMMEAEAPGLRASILGRRIATPEDLEAENPNLVGGDQICGSHHLSQNFLFRPMRGHADGSTPLRGLYLTGAAVWPGAGTGAGSGFLLARRLAGR